MAAAVTLTIEAAIIYGNGHYPNDQCGHHFLAAIITLTMDSRPWILFYLAPLGPPHLLGPQGNSTVVSLTDPQNTHPEDVGGHYLWQRPLP